MGKGRIEAFSDGVIAIIITIMVLELKVPHEPTIEGLRPLIPVFVSYALSFIYVGIYWNNHHHMFHAVRTVNGTVMWANLNLLFWLSLIPFVTAWMGENHFAKWPVICYGAVLVMTAVAYTILVKVLVKLHGESSLLARAMNGDLKGKMSLVIYLAAIGVSFLYAWLGFALYVVVACVWFIPDRRIEKRIANDESGEHHS